MPRARSANGHLAMGLIVLGAQSIFDAEWGGTMDRRVRAIAQQLSSELGYLGAATPAGQTGSA